MMYEEKENKFTAAAGFGSRSGRHEGGVDPATHASSSNQGPTVSSEAELMENVTTASKTFKEEEREGKAWYEEGRGPREPNTSTYAHPKTSRDDLSMEVETMSASRNNSSGNLDTLHKGKKKTFIIDSEEDSEDDAKSTASQISIRSNISTRSTRKRKTEPTDENISGKRKQQEENTYEEEEIKEPTRKLSSQKGKILGKIPTYTIKTEAELNSMHIEELKHLTLQMLDHLELAMNSSGNLQGRIKGIMKDRIYSIRDIASCFATKAEGKGDPLFYKMQNAELRTKIKCLVKEEDKWKVERSRFEEEIVALNKRNEEIEIKLWETSRGKYTNDEANTNTNIKTKTNIDTSKLMDTLTMQDGSYVPVKTPISKEDAEWLDKEWPIIRPTLKGRKKHLPTIVNPSKGYSLEAGPDQGPGPSSRAGPGPGSAPATKKERLENKGSKEMESIEKEIQRLKERKKQILLKSMKGGEIETEGEDRCEEETKTKTKTKPRIISNIQIIPPKMGKAQDTDTEEERKEETWKTVTGKKRNRIKRKENIQDEKRNRNSNKDPSKQPRIGKVPRTSAVTITAREGVSYAEILRKARENISLQTIGIETSKIRKGINGGVIIEIPGNDNIQKANDLANKLKEILLDKVRVSRPTAKSDIRVTGLDESVTKEEIRSVIADIGTCSEEEIRVGEICWMSNGLGTIWLQCPTIVANKIAVSGKIKIGWTVAKAVILAPRPLQCYRCWEVGHARYSCTSTIDRSNLCYKCGSSGHKIFECQAIKPNCTICAEKNLSANHRPGSDSCSMVKQVNKSRSRPLSRIRKEELDAKNRKKVQENMMTADPDRRVPEENMETDDVLS